MERSTAVANWRRATCRPGDRPLNPSARHSLQNCISYHPQPPKLVRDRFPNIYQRCLELGIDITRDRIPVVPAAHYTCGGVVINRQGETDIENLYAVGETTFSGLHGANRIASNSLSECFVIAFSAADSIRRKIGATDFPGLSPDRPDSRAESGDDILISHNWDELRRCMWDYVGIVRSDSRLRRAERRLELLREEIHEHFRRYRISRDMLELRNLALVAGLIVRSAGARRESRGCHCRSGPSRNFRRRGHCTGAPHHADMIQTGSTVSSEFSAAACAFPFAREWNSTENRRRPSRRRVANSRITSHSDNAGLRGPVSIVSPSSRSSADFAPSRSSAASLWPKKISASHHTAAGTRDARASFSQSGAPEWITAAKASPCRTRASTRRSREGTGRNCSTQ